MEKASEIYERKLRGMDEILHQISCMNQVEDEKQLSEAIPVILKTLGEYTGADRVYVFEWISETHDSLKNTYEWCAEGIEPRIDAFSCIPRTLMPEWTDTFLKDKKILVYNAENPEESSFFVREMQKIKEIHSLVMVPVYAGHRLTGFIGLDNLKMNSQDLSLNLLSDVGGHLGRVRENLRMMKTLEKEHARLEKSLMELKQEKNILDVLSVDYTSVYSCDLEEDYMIPLKQEMYSNAAAAEKQLGSANTSYSFRIRYYYDNFVIKESAPDFLEKLSAGYLIEYLKHHERFAYRFRCHPNSAGYQYFEVQIAPLKSIDGFKVVMGYRYIDDILEEQERQKAELEQALECANLNSEIINSISKLYWLIYRMDLKKGTYEEVSAGQEMHRLTGKQGPIEEVFKEARQTIVDVEFQESMREFFDMSTLAERLKDTESIEMEYRAASGSWHLAQFIVKKRDRDGNVTNVLYVVRQINKEKQMELKRKQEAVEYNRVLSGLSLDYTIAFVLNLDTDDYKIIFCQETNHAQIRNDISKFSEYVDQYVKAFTLPEFQDAMRLELGCDRIRERFKTEHDYHFSFETIPNAAGLCSFQAHIVKEYDGNDHFAFLGFRSVDEIVKQERFYKQALQNANQALRRQLDMISFALPGGVKISNDDETYSFKYVSEQFAKMLGYDTPDELMEASGGTIVGLAHPDDLESGIAEALDQYTRADHYEITYRMKCKDGSWKYIEDRGHKFRNAEGVVEHWNLILDKNELMEKTIALESEKRANQSKSEFLSRMSHDMRTPLNGIIGLLDICIKHPDDRKLVDSSRLKARVAADHLLSLINDTLELSKLENNDTSLDKEVFHLPTLFREVETLAQIRGDENGIVISCKNDMDELTYPYLIGSPLYVKQILLNLLSNGIKYNRKNGSVSWSFTQNAVSDKNVELHIAIRDTGIGMSKPFLKEIFKPFVQADPGARSTYMGTGLGMAIVKNLLERMGGTIRIDSTEGIGTSIQVMIPFEIARESAQKKEKGETEQKNLSRLRILLAEDNELNREIAAFILEDEGISVTEAVDGQQALELYLKKPEAYFDMVLMDIMMPMMDGYQAAQAIRNSGRKDAETIPIIAMTANAFDDDRRKTRAAGMDAHLSKPINVPELMETIGRLYYRNKNV